MECSLRNDGKTFQGSSVSVTEEEWDSSTKRMGRKKVLKKQRCSSPHKVEECESLSEEKGLRK